ncbi:MAG TPA: FHA domain-containing protein, partial [Hyphomicrobiales bacterium]|nr:FHA domain-containing protein [Hyphomicrobiales bacterium]
MALTLRIENETSLPDGGPLSVTVSGRRGLDLGRDQHLDWTLPDPSRFISGKHCEVRWHDGGYWLHDVSTNGTFLNGADHRLQAPHRLRNGDRLAIGHYIVAVGLDGEEAAAPAPPSTPAAASPADLWGPAGTAAPPMSPRDVQSRERRPVNPDFLDWAVEAPPPVAPADDARWAGPPRPAPE